jgi:hypothetical protein
MVTGIHSVQHEHINIEYCSIRGYIFGEINLAVPRLDEFGLSVPDRWSLVAPLGIGAFLERKILSV